MGSGGATKIINKIGNSEILGVGSILIRNAKLSAEKKGRKDQQNISAAQEAERAEKAKAIADASITAQKEKARKRTIFAGS